MGEEANFGLSLLLNGRNLRDAYNHGSSQNKNNKQNIIFKIESYLTAMDALQQFECNMTMQCGHDVDNVPFIEIRTNIGRVNIAEARELVVNFTEAMKHILHTVNNGDNVLQTFVFDTITSDLHYAGGVSRFYIDTSKMKLLSSNSSSEIDISELKIE